MDWFSTGQSCGLLDLPDEIKLNVVGWIDTKRDLLNLSMTCRVFEDITLTRLYQNLNINISSSSYDATNDPGLLLKFRPHIFRAVRRLSFRNKSAWSRNGAKDCNIPFVSQSVEEYASDIIGRIPRGRLASSTFFFQSSITSNLLEILSAGQNSSLREFRAYELATLPSTSSVPQNLTHLECRSIQDGEAVTRLIEENGSTLEQLRLGQDKELVHEYRRTRFNFLGNISQPLENFKLRLSFEYLPNLQSISLSGLDLLTFIPTRTSQALFFCKIKHLTLESCLGSGEFLEALARTFHHVQSNRLKDSVRLMPEMTEFLFRHEAPTIAMKESLVRFLASFNTLQKLSLLVENGSILERPAALIGKHGHSLRTLILETRVQPRECLSLDTSRPFGVGGYSQDLWAESINDISRLCPDLEELGIGFPWQDEMVRLRKTRLNSMKKLRTIHIRNFPEINHLSQVGEYAIKEYANKFIAWALPSITNSEQPSLESLAIGPILYESRWKIAGPRKQPPEFLRAHFFCLDWALNRFRKWTPMITSVSERYMEEIRSECPLQGVFEPVWLQ